MKSQKINIFVHLKDFIFHYQNLSSIPRHVLQQQTSGHLGFLWSPPILTPSQLSV